MGAAAEKARKGAIGDYYSAVQLRADRWTALRRTLDALERAETGHRGTVKL